MQSFDSDDEVTIHLPVHERTNAGFVSEENEKESMLQTHSDNDENPSPLRKINEEAHQRCGFCALEVGGL